MPNIKPLSNDNDIKTSTPINITIPTIENTVPIQNERRGLFLKNKKAITPTHMGARLVSSVPSVAVDCCIDKFKKAMSAANNNPQAAANRPTFIDGTLSVPVIVT